MDGRYQEPIDYEQPTDDTRQRHRYLRQWIGKLTIYQAGPVVHHKQDGVVLIYDDAPVQPIQ